jgi:hypothetical protein
VRRRGALLAAAALAVCTACGSETGLHIEDGGRTVTLHNVSTPTAPSPPGAHRRPHAAAELGAPAALAYDAGTLWCAVYPGPGLLGSLVRISTTTGRRSAPPTPLPTAPSAYLLAVGPDGVWLAAGTRLWSIDATTGSVAVTARLPGVATALQDAAGSLWVTVQTAPGGPGGLLVRVDPAGATVAQVATGPAPSALTVADGSVWVTDRAQQSIERFAIGKTRVKSTHTISLPESAVRAPTQITVEGSFVWVYERGRVLRIDPKTNLVVGTTSVAPAPGGTLAAGSGGIWVITRTQGRSRGAVRLLDASTGIGIGHRAAVGTRPTAIVTDGRGAWVLDSATERLYRVILP